VDVTRNASSLADDHHMTQSNLYGPARGAGKDDCLEVCRHVDLGFIYFGVVATAVNDRVLFRDHVSLTCRVMPAGSL